MTALLRAPLAALTLLLLWTVPALSQENPCPEGTEPHYNAALEEVVCFGTGGSTTRQEPLCPPGELAVLVDDEVLCLIAEARPAQACFPPYRQMTRDGCGWTCGEGTQPDETTGQCQCLPGLIEAGTDGDGRRICGLDPRTLVPVPGQPVLERDPANTPINPAGPMPSQIQPRG